MVLFSLISLFSLYLLSLFCGYILHISDDRFYTPFHFLGGALTGLFFYSLTNHPLLSITLTLITGLLWEVYEQIVWKIFSGKKKLRPKLPDTINDLLFDLLGSIIAITLIH